MGYRHFVLYRTGPRDNISPIASSITIATYLTDSSLIPKTLTNSVADAAAIPSHIHGKNVDKINHQGIDLILRVSPTNTLSPLARA